MANGKAMTVGEMASLFLDPATPVRIDAFDGSHFGPADAPRFEGQNRHAELHVPATASRTRMKSASCAHTFWAISTWTALTTPTRIRRCASWCRCQIRSPTHSHINCPRICRHPEPWLQKPPVPATEGPSKFARIKRGLMPHRKGRFGNRQLPLTTCPTSSTPTSLDPP